MVVNCLNHQKTYIWNDKNFKTVSVDTNYFIGCHKDSFEARLLTGSVAKSQEHISKYQCISRCDKEGYSLAGMQFGTECFCGERSLGDLKNHKIAEDRCNKNCPGDPSEKCGGYLTMNVYHTGSLPSKPGPSVLPQPGEC